MIGQVTKSKVERRLQKLEAVLTDDSQAVPHTHKWLIYWTHQIGKYMSEERKPVTPFIPVEAYRAVLKACEAGQVDSPYARIVRGEESLTEGAGGCVKFRNGFRN
ncbi:MAG TPA: hypothetical protein VGR73_09260 [Bryobacteraceae bacterium]|nr:hypothetical protein [Bryobacteraceae bacterium]